MTPQARADIERIFDFQFSLAPQEAAARIDILLAALRELRERPCAGRPATVGLRELIIAAAGGGYLALYRYDEVLSTVYVLALRSQRERGYKRDLRGT